MPDRLLVHRDDADAPSQTQAALAQAKEAGRSSRRLNVLLGIALVACLGLQGFSVLRIDSRASQVVASTQEKEEANRRLEEANANLATALDRQAQDHAVIDLVGVLLCLPPDPNDPDPPSGDQAAAIQEACRVITDGAD